MYPACVDIQMHWSMCEAVVSEGVKKGWANLKSHGGMLSQNIYKFLGSMRHC